MVNAMRLLAALGSKIHNYRLAPVWAGLSIAEVLFVLSALLLAMGFAVFNVEFARMGIPVKLPSSLGSLPGQEVKVFITEIFFIFSFFLFGVNAVTERRVRGIPSGNLTWFLMVGILVVGAISAIINGVDNPLLAIRNSSFVWYLVLPLAAYHSGVSLGAFRALAVSVSIGLVVVFFLFFSAQFFLVGSSATQWFLPFGGIIGLFLMVLLGKSKQTFLIFSFPLALAVASGYFFPVNRTTVLAHVLALGMVLLLWENKKFIFKRIIYRFPIFVALILVSVPLWQVRFSLPSISDGLPFLNFAKTDIRYREPLPLEKHIYHSEGKFGLELYRLEMWKDALNLFLDRPFFGIGFDRQVVFRLYDGMGNFKPNNIDAHIGPPVSGPHNSYLNAVARLGIGGGLFVFLHGFSIFLFWKYRENNALWVFFAQSFFAVFNVALESSLRSFPLLLLLGMALVLGDMGSARDRLKST